MYFTIGFYLGLIILSIMMGSLFFRKSRRLLEDIFDDYDLGNALNVFREFEEGNKFTKSEGLMSFLFAFFIMLFFSLMAKLITWLLWPLIMILILYLIFFNYKFKDK